jgi:hypothetical protein
MKRTMALDALGVVSVLIPLVMFGACGSSGNGGAGGSAGGTGKVDGGSGGSSGSTLDANVPDGSIQSEVGAASGNGGAGGSAGGTGKVDGGSGGSSGSTLDANVPSGGSGGSTRDAGGADVPATSDTAIALDTGSPVDGAADWSGVDAPATDGTQAAHCLSACNANATCVSGDGGEATCACNPGYFGDGYSCSDVAVSLAGLRWELPCNDTTYEPTVCGCAASATDTKTIGGVSTAAYDVTLRFRGVVEENTCTGGVQDGFWCVGGSMGGSWNAYKLTTTHDGQKDQVFYLNAGSSGLFHSYAIDYQRTLRIYGGSIVHLDAQTGDSREVKNISADTNGQPFVIPGVAPAPLAFNGQFIQVDVVSIVQVSP